MIALPPLPPPRDCCDHCEVASTAVHSLVSSHRSSSSSPSLSAVLCCTRPAPSLIHHLACWTDGAPPVPLVALIAALLDRHSLSGASRAAAAMRRSTPLPPPALSPALGLGLTRVALLLGVVVVALVCASASGVSAAGTGHLPIQAPVAMSVQPHAPTDRPSEPSLALPLLAVAPSPEERSAGLYSADEFPAEPRPRLNVNQEPLPLSPPGTYMHSAVRIGSKMFVYGGVASYEADKYMNDMWLFDFGASEFVQLQGSFVPPLPTHAGLSTGDAAAFAPRDVPSMPGMATAPRHESFKVEALHPQANPASPFLPRQRAQRPVRVVALEHIYEKDAHKPTAAGHTIKQIYANTKKGMFAQQTGQKRNGAAKGAPAAGGKGARFQAREAAETAFLQSEERLSLHHRQRSRFVSRAMRAMRDAAAPLHRATAFPGDNAGSAYSDPRFHRDGVAADSRAGLQRAQSPATQKHHPGTQTPESARSDARERAPQGLQDFWCYDFDTHSWALVNVTTSQPLARSPWLTPAQLNDPVFKDPLPILLPPSRRLHTAVVMKERMVVFGGVSSNNLILGDIWIYDPSESSWIEASADGPGGSPILPREGHSAVTLKDGLTMLVFGGVSYGFLPFNDLWSYSAVDNAWTRLTGPNDRDAPLQRWLHTSVYHERSDSMVVFGGLTAHYVPLNDVHVYSVGEHAWRAQATTGTPPFPRMMHTAVTVNDLMLVAGGAANNLPMDDMFVLDMRTWAWRELLQTGGYPFARTGATAIVLSPDERREELGELEDISPDAKDPHLNWAADLAALAKRPVVGSFSNEGPASALEEQAGSMAGLDAIAFPQDTSVPLGGSEGVDEQAKQRPVYRYRKHSKNNFYMILFGGASATSAPQDNTRIEKEMNSDN